MILYWNYEDHLHRENTYDLSKGYLCSNPTPHTHKEKKKEIEKQLLTPSHPVSVSLPQCQTPNWLVLMLPAARWAPRSAVHGWTKPVEVKTRKAVGNCLRNDAFISLHIKTIYMINTY